MCFRQLFQKSAIFLLSALLFGCAPGGMGGDISADVSGKKAIGKYHYHRGDNAASDPDNVATEDYYNNSSPVGNAQDDLWASIRENFQLNHYANSPAVQAQISWFMHNQGYLNRTARRAAPFMYYIYQEVKARNLPSELVLLPIMESAYNPFVSSSAGAAGLWQLIPGTARNFGVKQDFWYDGRRDISASTKAALDYLSYLQNFFGGDWLLAMAAYDAGEGTVASAVHRNARAGLKTDYWSLRLPNETEAYVPRLLALAVIISNPRAYSIDLPPINNSAYLGQVEVSSQLTLDQAAQLAGVSLTELKILNPGYKRSTLSPNEPYKLLLPIDRIPSFKRSLLGQSNASTNGLWSRYKVQPNDTWDKIAKRFSTTVNLLQTINRIQSDKPPVGTILLIPENTSNESALATATTQQTPPPTSENDNDANVSVSSSNETTDISTTPKPDLSDAASLDKSAMESADKQTTQNENNQSISSGSPHLSKIIHTVKQGETLSNIAHANKIAVIELARWNHLSEQAHLKPGMKLIIFKKETSSTHASSQKHKTQHKIVKHSHTR
jgi:membrane-bound lytic murein transglycosylase D